MTVVRNIARKSRLTVVDSHSSAFNHVTGVNVLTEC